MTKKIILDQKRQFNPHVINELAKKTVSFSEIESYVTILFDEMKIQENLVWDKHSGKLIMFVDISGININYNYATLENVQKCYTCFSVFSQKCCEAIILQFCNFCRFQIMSIFWQAVKYLERIKLKLIAATADGASQNKIFLECINIFVVIQMLMLFIVQEIFIQKKCVLFTFLQIPHIW